MSKEGDKKMVTDVTGISGLWPVGQLVQRGEVTETPGTVMPQVDEAEEAQGFRVEISEEAKGLEESGGSEGQVFAAQGEKDENPLLANCTPVKRVLEAYAKASEESQTDM